jgi:hypothetical protein
LVLTAPDLGPAWIGKGKINVNEGGYGRYFATLPEAYARHLMPNFMVALWTFFMYAFAGRKRESS